jgi:hypothetical protein
MRDVDIAGTAMTRFGKFPETTTARWRRMDERVRYADLAIRGNKLRYFLTFTGSAHGQA